MKRTDILKTIKEVSTAIDAIADEQVKAIQKILLNLVEVLYTENEELRAENQKLKDEVNRLKGEQGKPKVRKQKKSNKNDDGNGSRDHSSEENRKSGGGKKTRKQRRKKNEIKVDRTVKLEVDKSILPSDAKFKGYESSVFQEIIITTDNVEFKREIYYSKSLGKTFIAPLPQGWKGDFGPNFRAWLISFYNHSELTQPALKAFFETVGLYVSKSTISRMQTDNHEAFHQEKKDIIEAGLASDTYVHLDDTSGRENGINKYVHVLANPLFSAYITTARKDRLTIIEILSQGNLKFCFNEDTVELMKDMGLSNKYFPLLKEQITSTENLTREAIDEVIKKLFPKPKKGTKSQKIILEASAIIAYRQREDALQHLIVDDAPQFKKILKYLGLCWIHEGRHYKKLNPLFYQHKEILDKFLDDFWDYYKRLLDYKKNPTEKDALILEREFEALFSRKTGYDVLDERIKKTHRKVQELLLVLKFPHLPLHNNPAELTVRVQARKRDIHLQTKNEKGTQAKDTFATIIQTAKKLQVNIFDYIFDRLTKRNQMPSLASMIQKQGQQSIAAAT